MPSTGQIMPGGAGGAGRPGGQRLVAGLRLDDLRLDLLLEVGLVALELVDDGSSTPSRSRLALGAGGDELRPPGPRARRGCGPSSRFLGGDLVAGLLDRLLGDLEPADQRPGLVAQVADAADHRLVLRPGSPPGTRCARPGRRSPPMRGSPRRRRACRSRRSRRAARAARRASASAARAGPRAGPGPRRARRSPGRARPASRPARPRRPPRGCAARRRRPRAG